MRKSGDSAARFSRISSLTCNSHEEFCHGAPMRLRVAALRITRSSRLCLSCYADRSDPEWSAPRKVEPLWRLSVAIFVLNKTFSFLRRIFVRNAG
ncbi:hypothetical protein APED_31845 [Acanthopleuribacter pedis]